MYVYKILLFNSHSLGIPNVENRKEAKYHLFITMMHHHMCTLKKREEKKKKLGPSCHCSVCWEYGEDLKVLTAIGERFPHGGTQSRDGAEVAHFCAPLGRTECSAHMHRFRRCLPALTFPHSKEKMWVYFFNSF